MNEMNKVRHLLLLVFAIASVNLYAQKTPVSERIIDFDRNWKFKTGEYSDAVHLSFDDSDWRMVDLPHDWSIEELPGQEPGKVIGPFSVESPGGPSTGNVMGGIAWYRKIFTLPVNKRFSRTIINFDGVYMDCDIWVNGKKAGTHPYGYTAFDLDITDYLNRGNKPNIIAVNVRNEGENTRWYSGSGIYRHVWMIRKEPVHIINNGVFITTEGLSSSGAEIKIAATVNNTTAQPKNVKLQIKLIDPKGKIVQGIETLDNVIPVGKQEISQLLAVAQPQLWSPDEPNLYKAEIDVISDNIVVDKIETTFGIRTIHFDAKTGFTLNGKNVLLKGGCLHHDNGFLGAAAIDRAEERRVELMKAYGFNAIRCSHNPPSTTFLDACDRIGMLVVDEAFDMWERAKNPQDYHRFFKEWCLRDIESMVVRDRNHPSVIMWSIGNEINERAETLGYEIAQKLVDEVRRHDTTRPITNAICHLTDHPGWDWETTTAPAFDKLDVGGYNYLWWQYEIDHKSHPDRVMMGTESTPEQAYDTWSQVKKNSYVIGDFLWTGMDHLGESGIGSFRLNDSPDSAFCQPWPWFNNFSGDIDLCGNEKPQYAYRKVVWGRSEIEMAVHAPLPEGKWEKLSYWGWPNELPCWNWEGHEGRVMDVRVFSAYPIVRLELNGRFIDEKKGGDATKLITTFKVPYEPGVLKAIGVVNGIEMASTELMTVGKPARIRLVADRKTIRMDRNDLSYVKIEILDAQGKVIPNAVIPLKLSCSGVGFIAGSGNANPKDMKSFNNPVCETYCGRALAILRPQMNPQAGAITLKVEADGLPDSEIVVSVE